jgi:hypothetical protein
MTEGLQIQSELIMLHAFDLLQYSKSLLLQNFCDLKFLDILNFTLNLRSKEEKFTQIYLVIFKTLVIHKSKENLSCCDSFHTVLP